MIRKVIEIYNMRGLSGLIKEIFCFSFNISLKLFLYFKAKCLTLLLQVYDLYYDYSYSIKTSEHYELKNLKEFSEYANNIRCKFGVQFVDSIPTSYYYIKKAFDNLPIDCSKATLIDIGSGSGRVLCSGLMHGFKKVIGIELSTELSNISENNIKTIKNKINTIDYKVYNIDIRDFNYEDDFNVVFMYNPIRGEVLIDFINKLVIRNKFFYLIYVRSKADKKLVNINDKLSLLKKVDSFSPNQHAMIAIYSLKQQTDIE